ncbi:acyl-CoA dehydrogenase [Leucobacter zeae]|nr:acyl-CoA dehydrogenase [Leucobacter zeae]
MATQQSRKTRKVAAIAAGALVVGLGAAYTLASWNDSEWVWGGADGAPGVGTSEFEVEQSVDNGTTWTNDVASPGGSLSFTPNALLLSPGDTTYAPVSLRTQAGSVAADTTLQAAVKNTAVAGTSDDLWNAVRVTAYTSSAASAPACTGSLTGWTAVQGVENVALGTSATQAQRLAAGADETTEGAPQHYCFAITLPEGASDALQGASIAPVWRFESESVAP